MHDFSGVFLRHFAFELDCELLLPMIEVILCTTELIFRAEGSRSWVQPGICCIEVRGVLVRAQIHVEGQVLLRTVSVAN